MPAYFSQKNLNHTENIELFNFKDLPFPYVYCFDVDFNHFMNFDSSRRPFVSSLFWNQNLAGKVLCWLFVSKHLWKFRTWPSPRGPRRSPMLMWSRVLCLKYWRAGLSLFLELIIGKLTSTDKTFYGFVSTTVSKFVLQKLHNLQSINPPNS